MHTNQLKRDLPCPFTESELAGKSQQLAAGVSNLLALEDAKKESASNFKMQMEGVQAEVKKLSRQISSKHDMRIVDCIAHLDTGHDGTGQFGVKQIYRTDTGEWVGEENMSPEDRQLVMDLQPRMVRDEDEAKAARKKRGAN